MQVSLYYIIDQNKASKNDLAYPKFASAREINAYEDYQSALNRENENSFDNEINISTYPEENFGKEYKLRIELAQNIKILEKLDPLLSKELISESVDILNSQDLEDIERQSLALKSLIASKKIENVSSDYSLNQKEVEQIEKASQEFIEYGKLFANNSSNAKKQLDLLKEAIINSRAYAFADTNMAKAYDEALDANKLSIIATDKDVEKAFKDLEDFVYDLNKDEDSNVMSLSLSNTKFNASDQTTMTDETEMTETSTIENPSQNAEASTSNQSPFLANEKTRGPFNELTDSQKRELEAIDTNKNGILSKDELDNSANFSSNIDSSSWLYPFTEKALEAPNTNVSDKADEDKPAMPQTVTIDEDRPKSPNLESDNTDDTADDRKEEFNDQAESPLEEEKVPSKTLDTSAASVVKTGIKSLGILVVILVLAIIGYYILKKQDKKDNDR